VINITKLK